jgi:hypothetical protein
VKSIHSHHQHATVAPFVPSGVLRAEAFSTRLNRLYARSEHAPAIFASPLGPIATPGRQDTLPRFLYLSPFGADETLRVAVYAGYGHYDERSTDALLHFLERLLLTPDLGDGINLTFFPLVDVLGQISGEVRGLAAESWLNPQSPEIELLARDARQRGYDVYVRLEAKPVLVGSTDDLVTVRLRGDLAGRFSGFGGELLSSADFEPFPVRFETEADGFACGPLTLSEDLGREPMELTIILPESWTPELYREAVSHIFKQLLLRYRRHQAYAQHI